MPHPRRAACPTVDATGQARPGPLRPDGGGAFDWGETPAGRLFEVKTGPEPPAGAYIATFYRGHWFWIDDDDLQSKSTFMLLRQLFDLQAGQNTVIGPTLTMPVGR